MKRFIYIIGLFVVILSTGCDKKESTTTTSSVAQLKSFAFASNDSMPGLEAAVFTVKERLDTGLVENTDSIMYGTSLESVVPRFTFAATPGAAFVTTPDTVCTITGYDTLDFSKRPIYLTIRSSDNTNTKTYEIQAFVHQVDPDLYTWTQLTDKIYDPDDSEQQVVEMGDDFILFAYNGFAIHTYRSSDGITWTSNGAVTGLPAGTKVRQIISTGDTLYYGADSTVYRSVNATTWTAHKTPFNVQTILLYWNNNVWALVDTAGYELAIWRADSLALTGLRPAGDFPISDFATVCFHSASTRERAMIIGGFADNGRSLNTRWNLEYSTHPLPDGEYRMQEFSIDRPAFTSLTGVSVVEYNHQLLLFGGVDDKMNYFGRDILISEDEGLTWTKADTTKNQLPAVYQARQKQTAVVRDNYIYVFGGQDTQKTYSDVYRGRLNSIDW